MGTLFIIGNGFDLHFKLKTKTNHFVEHLKAQPVYNEVGNAFDVLDCYGVDWYEYEQSLNDIDLDEIQFQNENQPDYLSDRESDRDGGILNMQMYVDSLSEAIEAALVQMVIEANNDIFALSRYYQPPRLFKAGDAILTFNYTSTIEQLFDVPRTVPICHIHGCYDQGNPLVFGYRNNQNSYAEAWADIDEEHWDYYIAQQRGAVYAFYANWEKKLRIAELMSFLSCCKGIDRIVVLGHSMSAVDAEYMEQVDAHLNPVVWDVSYYNSDDITRVRAQGYSFQRKICFETMDTLLNR